MKRLAVAAMVASILILSLPGGYQCECGPDDAFDQCCHPIPPTEEIP